MARPETYFIHINVLYYYHSIHDIMVSGLPFRKASGGWAEIIQWVLVQTLILSHPLVFHRIRLYLAFNHVSIHRLTSFNNLQTCLIITGVQFPINQTTGYWNNLLESKFVYLNVCNLAMQPRMNQCTWPRAVSVTLWNRAHVTEGIINIFRNNYKGFII